MKLLDLFAGTRSISKVADQRGWETYSVELDKRHPHIDWYTDVLEVRPDDIIARFGRPDVIWASPPCTTYSIAGISHHRRKMPDTLAPISKYAQISDRLVLHTLFLIRELNPTYWYIENPRGGLRKMSFMQDLPRYTVTYCQYGHDTQKPTDIWTNHPDPQFLAECKQGAPCHESAPRGSRSGIQGKRSAVERSIVPSKLCEHIVEVSI